MMKRYINELKRALNSPAPYISLVICLATYYISFDPSEWASILHFRGTGSVVDKHNAFLIEFNPYRNVLPLSATIPYCFVIAEEIENRAVYFMLNRMSLKQYMRVKYITAGILGGLVLSIGLVIFLNVCGVYLPLYTEDSYYEPFIKPVLHTNSLYLYVMYWGSLQFILGFLCAGLGCFVAIFTAQRGVIYLFPMVMLCMIEIVTNFTIIGLSGGQSSIVFSMKHQTPFAVYLQIILILSSFLILTYVMYATAIKRRLYIWQ